ncbi:MAG: lytic transglycosylase domain-containing protein [Nocardioides sp.]
MASTTRRVRYLMPTVALLAVTGCGSSVPDQLPASDDRAAATTSDQLQFASPASVSSPAVIGSTTRPAVGGQASQITQTSSTNGIPSAALAAYQRAETVINAADAGCHLPWQLLAAVGRIESDHGRFGGSSLSSGGVAVPAIIGVALDGTRGTAVIRDTDAGVHDGDLVFDRAVGPMQFLPATWSEVGVDADDDGERNPQDIDDSALAAAVYLCADGDDLATESGRRGALLRYNHSTSYAALVLDVMRQYVSGEFMSVPNFVTSAGVLTPLPVADDKPRRPHRGPDTDEPSPTPEPEPTPEPSPEPAPEPGPKPTLPPVVVPTLPPTGIKPVDELLDLAHALAQCTIDGFLDDPTDAADDFDLCVAAYTTPLVVE